MKKILLVLLLLIMLITCSCVCVDSSRLSEKCWQDEYPENLTYEDINPPTSGFSIIEIKW